MASFYFNHLLKALTSHTVTFRGPGGEGFSVCTWGQNSVCNKVSVYVQSNVLGHEEFKDESFQSLKSPQCLTGADNFCPPVAENGLCVGGRWRMGPNQRSDPPMEVPACSPAFYDST